MPSMTDAPAKPDSFEDPFKDRFIEAMALLEKGEETEALECIKVMAEEGSRHAQHLLGSFHAEGRLVPEDLGEAIRWYLKSAEQGLTSSALALGWIFLTKDSHLDVDLGLYWLNQAAEEGDAQAANILGEMHYSGVGSMKPDYPKAVIHFEKGAALGDSVSKQRLAWMYSEGLGVEADPEKALTLNMESAVEGNPIAACNAGIAFERGQGTEVDITKAMDYYRFAADCGVMIAQHNLGALLANGSVGEPDFKEAMHWYLKAASLGSPMSRYNIGTMYEKGQGVEKSAPIALAFFMTGAQIGDGDSKTKADALTRRLSPEEVGLAEVVAERLLIDWAKNAQPPVN